MQLNTVHQCNVLNGFPMIESNSVQTTVTSPPYYGKRSYENHPDQIGCEKTPEEYIEKMVHVFREVRRVTREDGTLWLNLGDSWWGGKGISGAESPEHAASRATAGLTLTKKYQSIGGIKHIRPTDRNHPRYKAKDLIGIPWQVAMALRDDGADIKTCIAVSNAIKRIRASFEGTIIPDNVLCVLENLEAEYAMAKGNGWNLRMDNIWSKPDVMPEAVYDRCSNQHEYIFLLAKNNKKTLAWRAIDTREWVLTKPDVAEKVKKIGVDGKEKWVDRWQGFKYFYDQDAILRDIAPSTISRIKQGKLDNKRNPRPGVDTHSGNQASESGIPSIGEHGKTLKANKRSIWVMACGDSVEEHFAVFPQALPRTCIKAGSKRGDLVFDPFMGSGTTADVAIELGRYYVGCDLIQKYIGIHNRKLHKRHGLFSQAI